MPIAELHRPITVFSLDDFMLDTNKFIEKSRDYFFDLPWDTYDMRKKQLDFVKENSDDSDWKNVDPEFLKKYFVGENTISALRPIIKKFTPENQERFEAIKPFRRRSAMRLHVTFGETMSNWRIDRIPVQNFLQERGVIHDNNCIDYRQCPRQFLETDDAIRDDGFESLVSGIANLVRANTAINELDITVHHTYVEATQESVGDNSPEGIHQDGYDYIVSALVIERKDIEGGISQIFSDDKKTKLFSTTLRSGQGIFQPDMGTCLWHNVTPFSVLPTADIGYRTSIGFDIEVE